MFRLSCVLNIDTHYTHTQTEYTRDNMTSHYGIITRSLARNILRQYFYGFCSTFYGQTFDARFKQCIDVEKRAHTHTRVLLWYRQHNSIVNENICNKCLRLTHFQVPYIAFTTQKIWPNIPTTYLSISIVCGEMMNVYVRDARKRVNREGMDV